MTSIKMFIKFLSQFPEDTSVSICSNEFKEEYGVPVSVKSIDTQNSYDFNEHFEWYSGSNNQLIIGRNNS